MQAEPIIPEFKDSNEAFEQAIVDGRLSRIRSSANYAGSYMYMGAMDGIDQFNIITREYLGGPSIPQGVVVHRGKNVPR